MSSTALALTPENTAMAIAAAAQEEGANEIGRLLKFSKGHYLVGTEEIPLGREYVAHVECWTRGWIKFRHGELVERKVGRVADGFAVPQRDELDDTDESLWEKGPGGQPTDPWTQQSYLPLEDVATGDILTFVSGSVGGRQAVSGLAARAARQMVTMGLPRIELAVESYKHKQFGAIAKPSFSIVGWTNPRPKAEVVQLVAQQNHDEFSDDVPF